VGRPVFARSSGLWYFALGPPVDHRQPHLRPGCGSAREGSGVVLRNEDPVTHLRDGEENHAKRPTPLITSRQSTRIRSTDEIEPFRHPLWDFAVGIRPFAVRVIELCRGPRPNQREPLSPPAQDASLATKSEPLLIRSGRFFVSATSHQRLCTTGEGETTSIAGNWIRIFNFKHLALTWLWSWHRLSDVIAPPTPTSFSRLTKGLR